MLRTRAANHLLWTNPVFENVTGDVALDTLDSGSTATYYFTMVDSEWRGRGPRVVTDTQSFEVGTLFVGTTFAQSGGSLVAAAGDQSLFAWRSRSNGGARAGAVRSGLFIDSSLGPRPRPLELIENGTVTTFEMVPGPATADQAGNDAPPTSAAGAIFGGLMRKAKDRQAAKDGQSGEHSALLDSLTEILRATNTASSEDVAIPAGFRLK